MLGLTSGPHFTQRSCSHCSVSSKLSEQDRSIDSTLHVSVRSGAFKLAALADACQARTCGAGRALRLAAAPLAGGLLLPPDCQCPLGALRRAGACSCSCPAGTGAQRP